jgi:hypothetical protein
MPKRQNINLEKAFASLAIQRVCKFVNSHPETPAFPTQESAIQRLWFYKVRFLRFGPCLGEALHCSGRIAHHIVRDNHHLRQQQAEIKLGPIPRA